MDDYNSYRRSAGTAPRRTAHHAKAAKKATESGITVVQAIVCAVLLACALIFRLTGGTGYIRLQNIVQPVLRDSISAKQANQVFNKFKGDFPDAVSVFDNLTKNASSGRALSPVSSLPALSESTPGCVASSSCVSSSAAAQSGPQVSSKKAAAAVSGRTRVTSSAASSKSAKAG